MKVEQKKKRLSALLVAAKDSPQSDHYPRLPPWHSELGWQVSDGSGHRQLVPLTTCVEARFPHLHFSPSAFLSHQPYLIPNVLGIFFPLQAVALLFWTENSPLASDLRLK